MLLRSPKNLKELEFCINAYLEINDDSFLFVDTKKILRRLELYWKKGYYVKIVEEDSEIIGWMYANIIDIDHIEYPVYQQFYCQSIVSGIKAFKVIKLLHEDLIRDAERKGIQLIISNGSQFDSNFTFSKILEKLGWIRRNYINIWKTSHYQE